MTTATDRIRIAGVEVSPDHFIGGERVASGRRFEDISPIDGEVIGEISCAGEAEVSSVAQRGPALGGFVVRGRRRLPRRFARCGDLPSPLPACLAVSSCRRVSASNRAVFAIWRPVQARIHFGPATATMSTIVMRMRAYKTSR